MKQTNKKTKEKNSIKSKNITKSILFASMIALVISVGIVIIGKSNVEKTELTNSVNTTVKSVSFKQKKIRMKTLSYGKIYIKYKPNSASYKSMRCYSKNENIVYAKRQNKIENGKTVNYCELSSGSSAGEAQIVVNVDGKTDTATVKVIERKRTSSKPLKLKIKKVTASNLNTDTARISIDWEATQFIYNIVFEVDNGSTTYTIKDEVVTKNTAVEPLRGTSYINSGRGSSNYKLKIRAYAYSDAQNVSPWSNAKTVKISKVKSTPPAGIPKAACYTKKKSVCLGRGKKYCKWQNGSCSVKKCLGGKVRYTDGNCY